VVEAMAQPPAADDATRWETVARIRGERSGWVVIWMASAGCYRAYPLFRAPRGTAVTAANPNELTAQMDQVQQAACRPLTGHAQPHHDPR
jgi:hypothetical protein